MRYYISYDVVNDGVVLCDSSEFVDVPSIERAACERANSIFHGSYFLHFVVDNVISFTFVGDHLIVCESSENIDIFVVDAQ